MVKDFTQPLNLERALKLQHQAISQASEMGVAIAISVADAGGHLLSFARMEGVGAAAVDIVVGKARTAALFGMSTHVLAQIALQKPGILSTGAIALDGGIPLMLGTKLIGAIGVGGLSPEQDHDLAIKIAGAQQA